MSSVILTTEQHTMDRAFESGIRLYLSLELRPIFPVSNVVAQQEIYDPWARHLKVMSGCTHQLNPTCCLPYGAEDCRWARIPLMLHPTVISDH